MSHTFTEDDVGKTVENADGEEIGTVAAVDRGTALVDPDPGIVDSIRAALGWEPDPEDTVPLNESAVGEVTADVIRLEGRLSAQDGAVGGDLAAETGGDAAETDRGGGDEVYDAGEGSGEPGETGPTAGQVGEESDRDVRPAGTDESGTDVGPVDDEIGRDAGGESGASDDRDERGQTGADVEGGERDPRMDPAEHVGVDELDGAEEMRATEDIEDTGSAGRPEGDRGGTDRAGTDRDESDRSRAGRAGAETEAGTGVGPVDDEVGRDVSDEREAEVDPESATGADADERRTTPDDERRAESEESGVSRREDVDEDEDR